MTTTVGFVHPGAMGASIAAASNGITVWASEGRSSASTERASDAQLEDVGTIDAMVEQAEVIVSVCPPGAALAQAREIADAGFDGIYVDANAISPSTARDVAALFANFVDGGIIGPPASQAGTTRLYLAGGRAESVAALWKDSALETRLVDGPPGAASAVKMCFAAWTKGTSALLLNVRALADAEGVTGDLLGEWATSMPDLIARSDNTAAGVGPKAWRFGPEMVEIADSFTAASLPDGFHRGAAEVYGRLAEFKDQPAPNLDQVIRALTD